METQVVVWHHTRVVMDRVTLDMVFLQLPPNHHSAIAATRLSLMRTCTHTQLIHPPTHAPYMSNVPYQAAQYHILSLCRGISSLTQHLAGCRVGKSLK
jgi:hypothetical protein